MFTLRKYRLFETLDDLNDFFLNRVWFIITFAMALVVAVVVGIIILQTVAGVPISQGIFLLLVIASPTLGISGIILYAIFKHSKPLYNPDAERRTRQELARAAVIKQHPEFTGTHPALLDTLYGIE